ncbi:hATC-domain-containing protein, partial [Fistulina hepatica ATCC 64428]
AIKAGLANLNKWYNKTADTDVYFICLALDPNTKTAYTRNAWSQEEYDVGLCTLEEKFDQYYVTASLPTEKTSKLPPTSQDGNRRNVPHASYGSAWMKSMTKRDQPSNRKAALTPRVELEAYLAAPLESEVRDIIAWWGNHATQYPTLSRMARDYLAIQGSAVAAERTFSSGALTDTLRRNRIKPDLFGALQILKGGYCNGYISSDVQAELRAEENAQRDILLAELGARLDDVQLEADETAK